MSSHHLFIGCLTIDRFPLLYKEGKFTMRDPIAPQSSSGTEIEVSTDPGRVPVASAAGFVAVLPSEQLPPSQHPAMVYLASLAPGSRRGVRSSLQVCSELLSSGQCDWQTLPWHLLGPQHTQALRAALADRYAAASANKMLAAIRGVLRAAWELGQIETDRYHRAVAFRSVRGQTLPRGRSISQGSCVLCLPRA